MKMKKIRRYVRLYCLGFTGRGFACPDAFEGHPHEPHDWVGTITDRVFHCRGMS